MNHTPLEIIIPVFNEGEKILKLMNLLEQHVSTKFKVLFCYDSDDDDLFNYKEKISNLKFETKYIKNPSRGPSSAIIQGFKSGNSDCVIVYPADDFLNLNILDEMYKSFLSGNDVVVASRFIKGGSMKNCPIIKSILVRSASFTLYYLSSIPVKDASNGFRLFSRKLLQEVNIESEVGFAYSLELLVKCNRLKYNIKEIPAQWEERSEGESRFKVFKWLPQYLKWYIYGLETTWLKKRKI
jgi:dolichol-phosphate mannosyltransferase|tara:strand:- start:3418 stop:4137 length:720 start_codon:yes stop_codon:yes gene_type:complete